MKPLILNFIIGVFAFIAGFMASIVTVKHLYDFFKMLPGYVWIGSAILAFVWLVIFFIYKLFRLFPDIYSDAEEGHNKGDIQR